MTVEIKLAPVEQRYVFANMWIAYAHELSQYQDDLPSVHGMMGDSDEDYEQDSIMAEWWEHPGGAFPYVITVDERPAGFALIAAPPLVDGGADKELIEFFLFYPYRGKGIGRTAATKLFEEFKGTWQLSVMESNTAAIGFWNHVLTNYTRDVILKQKFLDDSPMTEFLFTSPAEV